MLRGVLVPTCGEMFLCPPYSFPIITEHTSLFGALCVYWETDRQVFTVIITFKLVRCVCVCCSVIRGSWNEEALYSSSNMSCPPLSGFYWAWQPASMNGGKPGGCTGSTHTLTLMKGWCWCEMVYTWHAACTQLQLESYTCFSLYEVFCCHVVKT